jgi:hypothetical protein
MGLLLSAASWSDRLAVAEPARAERWRLISSLRRRWAGEAYRRAEAAHERHRAGVSQL